VVVTRIDPVRRERVLNVIFQVAIALAAALLMYALAFRS
jgi:hypothetical protein